MTPQQNSPSRAVTRDRHDSDEKAELPESKRRNRSEVMEEIQRKNLPEVRVTEKHPAGLDENTQAAIDNLERIKK